jgi:hypothetical protein
MKVGLAWGSTINLAKMLSFFTEKEARQSRILLHSVLSGQYRQGLVNSLLNETTDRFAKIADQFIARLSLMMIAFDFFSLIVVRLGCGEHLAKILV